MKKTSVIVTLLGILIIAVTVTFTIIIVNLLNPNIRETINSGVTTNTKVNETNVKDIPVVNREDGLNDMEFWTLFNYWNEKDGYGLPRVNTEDEFTMEFIGNKKVYMGRGVYLGYMTRIQISDEKYAPIWVTGELLENYDPEVLADVFRLTIKITEGEDSFLYRNLYQYTKEIIKGASIPGDNHEWTSKATPYEFSFIGFPYKDRSKEPKDVYEDDIYYSENTGAAYNDEDSYFQDNSSKPPVKIKEIFVTQGGKKIEEFYTPEEAIAFAEQLEDAEVFSPTAPIWDNKPSTVYIGEIFAGEFNSKQEAIKHAQNFENAKVINNKTGYVEWDNYPRECGRCESSIQDEYDPNRSSY